MEMYKIERRPSELRVHVTSQHGPLDSTDVMGAQSVASSMVSIRSHDSGGDSADSSRTQKKKHDDLYRNTPGMSISMASLNSISNQGNSSRMYNGSLNFAFDPSVTRSRPSTAASNSSSRANDYGTVFDELASIEQWAAVGATTLTEWREGKVKATRHVDALHEEIDARVEQLIDQVNAYAKQLHAKLDRASHRHLAAMEETTENIADVINRVTTAMNDLQRLSGKDNELSREEVTKLAQLQKSVKTSLLPAAKAACSQRPKWNIIQLSRPSVDPTAACNSLIGGLRGDMVRRGFDDDDIDLGGSISARLMGGKLPPPSMEEMGRFHVKSPKDVRECGITDMALTSSGCLVVVDKHNKFVKMFDVANAMNGSGVRSSRVNGSDSNRNNTSVATFIGLDCLKEPARVTVLRSVDHILVTDVGRAAVVEFDSKGNFVRTFVKDLKYPASVAETADGTVAVVDYDTKEVVFFDEEGTKLRSVKCGGGEKACPAFTICTTDGRLVTSDWQNNSVSVISAATGDPIATLTSANGVRFKQPHGLAEDPFGNIIVMDKGNHRVLVLDRDSFDVICAYVSDKERNSMRLPMSAAFSSGGDQLLVADYQGNVRAFKYTSVSKKQFVTERSFSAVSSRVSLASSGSTDFVGGNGNAMSTVTRSTVFVQPADSAKTLEQQKAWRSKQQLDGLMTMSNEQESYM